MVVKPLAPVLEPPLLCAAGAGTQHTQFLLRWMPPDSTPPTGGTEGDRRQGWGEGAGPFLRASWLASYAPGPLPLDLDAGSCVHQQLVPVSGPFPTPSSSPSSPPLRAFSPGPAAVPSRRSQFCSPSPKPLGLMTPTSSLCSSSPWGRKLLPALIIPLLFQGLPYAFGVLQYLFNQFLILTSLC